MKEILPRLLELCDVDRELHALKRQLALYPKMQAEMDAREAASKQSIAAAEEKFQKSREIRRKVELDVKALRDKIEKYQMQQGQVKTNKEYEAITHEIEGVKAKIEELDLTGIEALEREEQGEKEKAAAAREHQELVKHNGAERARIASQIAEKEAKRAEYQAEHDRRIAELPEELKENYELLNDRYPGAALASVADGHCNGCGMNLIKHLVHDVRVGEKLIRCEGCMRILYDPVNAAV
ncbi:hypothetical protein HY256_06780 [Candidatus Sumerlaeota bacterium]|nr:hypothetical protein [Candidatus Sumerlaeota bacterium]